MRVTMAVQQLAGKTVVGETGAGRGLGAAFSCILAEIGARVIMTGRNPETRPGCHGRGHPHPLWNETTHQRKSSISATPAR